MNYRFRIVNCGCATRTRVQRNHKTINFRLELPRCAHTEGEKSKLCELPDLHKTKSQSLRVINLLHVLLSPQNVCNWKACWKCCGLGKAQFMSIYFASRAMWRLNWQQQSLSLLRIPLNQAILPAIRIRSMINGRLFLLLFAIKKKSFSSEDKRHERQAPPLPFTFNIFQVEKVLFNDREL